ncbi:hypothetical protein [Pseudomonas sp. PE-S1G-1]|uniref:hypothetical protein n=1 Tax=Pseudomonas sp. PE-S1G-1 TaxID=1986995 RepID=UPI000B3FE6AC|nr:hypothetical protein [Pseudomonas sp. PE-S1G-1]
MEPVNLHAGDSIAWSRDVPAFPAASGWTLHYVFNGPDSHSVRAVSADPYRVELSASDTAGWAPGLYRWVALAVKGDLRTTVATGLVQVEPNWQTAGPADVRTHAARMIALIESALEKRIPKDQQSYEIDGLRLDRIPVERLRELRLQYQRELMQQRRQGSGLVRNVLVRL